MTAAAGNSLLSLKDDFYVPSFELIMVDHRLGKDVIRDITQVTYKDSIDQIDSFEITISNWDAQTRSFKYSDKDTFLPGKELELWMGYFGKEPLRLMIKGAITEMRPSFPAAGQPTLVISGLNLMHKLRTTQGTHTYEKMTDSQIARAVGQRLNMRVITNPLAEALEERYQYIIQEHEFDIVFLMKRARRIGYDLYVEERGMRLRSQQSALYFGPTVNSPEDGFRLTYGATLVEFTPSLNISNQVGSVRYRGWDAVNKCRIEHTAQREEITRRGVAPDAGRDAIERSFNNRQEVIATRPVNSIREGQTMATETHENIAKELLTGSGSTVGLPNLRAGSFVHIGGVGKRFSGRYFVKSTTHTIADGGYTTRFDGRRE
ncbi:MAG TPA: hypothetical protein VGD58_28415 [Herpetosiphonaceae bacterium]